MARSETAIRNEEEIAASRRRVAQEGVQASITAQQFSDFSDIIGQTGTKPDGLEAAAERIR